MNYIVDARNNKDFSNITFSGYKKKDVYKQFIDSINSNKLEDSLYWSKELICSGHLLDLWNAIIHIVCIHIYFANPKLPIYIINRYDVFKQIIENGYIERELELRNNKQIRTLFSEIIYVLCVSNKKHVIVQNIPSKDKINIDIIKNDLIAPHLKYASCFKDYDAKEILIFVNEFCFHIHETKSFNKATYWLEWLHCYEIKCKKNKKPIICQPRYTSILKVGIHKDFIWLIWECIIHESLHKNQLEQKIIESLFKMYIIRYTTAFKKKRIHVLYFAIMILCESIDKNINVLQSDTIKNIDNIVNNIYKQP